MICIYVKVCFQATNFEIKLHIIGGSFPFGSFDFPHTQSQNSTWLRCQLQTKEIFSICGIQNTAVSKQLMNEWKHLNSNSCPNFFLIFITFPLALSSTC